MGRLSMRADYLFSKPRATEIPPLNHLRSARLRGMLYGYAFRACFAL